MIILAVALAAAVAFIIWQNVGQDKTDETVKTQDDQVKVEGSEDEAKANNKTNDKELGPETGFVTGDVVFPAGGYPDDLRVCAVSETTGKEIACDKNIDKGSYTIELTPGEYKIVAKAGSIENGNVSEGYYDGYMKNELYKGSDPDVLCKSENHTPIILTIVAGQTLRNIDAGNFYYNADNCS